MDIFIRSAGSHPSHGYDWWRLYDDDKLTRTNRDFLDNFDLSWFDDDQLSLVLQISENRIILLVTGLPTKNRVDFAGRIIRNDMAFIAKDDSEAEIIKILCLTAAFLKAPPTEDLPISLQDRQAFLIDNENWPLAKRIDECIRESPKNEPGFVVNGKSLRNILEVAAEATKAEESINPLIECNTDKLKSKLDIGNFQVAFDSAERRKDLIKWLVNYFPLKYPTKLNSRNILILIAPYSGISSSLSESERNQYVNELKSRSHQVFCQLTNLVDWKDWKIIDPNDSIFSFLIKEVKRRTGLK